MFYCVFMHVITYEPVHDHIVQWAVKAQVSLRWLAKAFADLKNKIWM